MFDLCNSNPHFVTIQKQFFFYLNICIENTKLKLINYVGLPKLNHFNANIVLSSLIQQSSIRSYRMNHIFIFFPRISVIHHSRFGSARWGPREEDSAWAPRVSKTDLNTNRIVEEVTKSSQFDKNKPKSNQYNYQKVSFSMSLSFIVFERKKR